MLKWYALLGPGSETFYDYFLLELCLSSPRCIGCSAAIAANSERTLFAEWSASISNVSSRSQIIYSSRFEGAFHRGPGIRNRTSWYHLPCTLRSFQRLLWAAGCVVEGRKVQEIPMALHIKTDYGDKMRHGHIKSGRAHQRLL